MFLSVLHSVCIFQHIPVLLYQLPMYLRSQAEENFAYNQPKSQCNRLFMPAILSGITVAITGLAVTLWTEKTVSTYER